MAVQPNVNADDLIRATRRYEFSDGLVELQLSVVLASLGVSIALVFSPLFVRLVLGLSRTFGSWAKWLAAVIVLAPALIAVGTRQLLRAVRRRWIWRSSGFVEPLPSAVPASALVLGTAIVVVASVVAVMLYRSGGREPMLVVRALVASAGWAQGVSTIGVGRRTGLANYTRLGIAGGLASTVFLFLRLPFGQIWLAFCLLWALGLAISGLVSLRRALLRTHEVSRSG
jgi:hypothetical protein